MWLAIAPQGKNGLRGWSWPQRLWMGSEALAGLIFCGLLGYSQSPRMTPNVVAGVSICRSFQELRDASKDEAWLRGWVCPQMLGWPDLLWRALKSVAGLILCDWPKRLCLSWDWPHKVITLFIANIVNRAIVADLDFLCFAITCF